MKIAIVTGASSGMGREFVKIISGKLHSLDEIWVIARREANLTKLREEVSANLVILPLDLSRERSIRTLARILDKRKPNVKMLVNCAGFGKIGREGDIPVEEETGMVDVNNRALTGVTYTVLPYMTENSRIIQMASAAAFLPQPRFAVYAATKAYVLHFSRALNEELKYRDITVTAVCPGPVKTEFFDIAEETGKMPAYKHLVAANPVKVVRLAFHDSLRKKPVSVYGATMKLLWVASKCLPHSWLLKFF
jgi:short-subunit dehydrogenase